VYSARDIIIKLRQLNLLVANLCCAYALNITTVAGDAPAGTAADSKPLGPPKRSSLALMLQKQQDAEQQQQNSSGAATTAAAAAQQQKAAESVWHAASPPRPAKVPLPSTVLGSVRSTAIGSSATSGAAAPVRKAGWATTATASTNAAAAAKSFSHTAAVAAAVAAGRPAPAAAAAASAHHHSTVTAATAPAAPAAVAVAQGPAPGSWAARIAANRTAAAAAAVAAPHTAAAAATRQSAPIAIGSSGAGMHVRNAPEEEFPALGSVGGGKKGGTKPRGGAWGPKAYS
jgi:hypothetical protein